MRHEISNTTLVVTDIVCRFDDSSRFNDSGENGAILVVEDTATGEKGQVAISQEYSKRDVDNETQTTDNPRLFESNHPEADWCYGFEGDDIDPDSFVHFDHGLEYRWSPKANSIGLEGNGMFLEGS